MRAKNFVVNRGVSCFIRGVSCFIRGVSCFICGVSCFIRCILSCFIRCNPVFQSWSSRRERVKDGFKEKGKKEKTQYSINYVNTDSSKKTPMNYVNNKLCIATWNVTSLVQVVSTSVVSTSVVSTTVVSTTSCFHH